MTYREMMLGVLNHNVPKEKHLGNAVLGLCGESGEVADLFKKIEYQGHTMDRDKFIKELGDVRFYLELAAWVIGTDMAEIEAVNSTKLMSRYPAGFSPSNSINRKAE